MKKLVVGGVLTLIVLAALALALAPAIAERAMNRTAHAPPYAASERARELHRKLLIADLHADSLLWGRNLLERSTRGHVDVPRLIEGNVAVQAFTVVTKTPRGLNFERNDARTDNITLVALLERWPRATWRSLTERALYQASRLRQAAADSGGRLVLIRTAGDLRRYLERRRREPQITAGFLGIEGAHALDGNLANLDALFDAGFRMMSPTHFFDNDVGGSSAGVEKYGLTPMGREMVRRMEARGMLVDVSHASPRTIDDVLAMATRPVVASHTGVKATCDNSRNLSDAHLRGIARTGGVAGIAYFPYAVCGGEVRAIVRAIRHAANVAGVEHVALGSDFDGVIAAPFDTTGLVQLTDALLAEGFSEQEIAAIMGGNALRVLEQGLPEEK